jgi:uncharacterized membrane protein
MTGTLGHLLSAMIFFIGSHVIMSSLPVRTPLLNKLGDGGFKGVYSLIAAAGMFWVVTAWINAPHIVYWEPHTAFKHLSLSIMPLVCIFLMAAVTPKNPALINAGASQLKEGPQGIFRITRHPMMWATAVWGILHVLANGDGASLIFFGGLAVLALGGTHQVDRRKAHMLGDEWQGFAAQTSHIPFAAILAKRTSFSAKEIGWRPAILGIGLYLVLLILHETVFGVAPMSWVSGLFD